jgi:hypothetical protein
MLIVPGDATGPHVKILLGLFELLSKGCAEREQPFADLYRALLIEQNANRITIRRRGPDRRGELGGGTKE